MKTNRRGFLRAGLSSLAYYSAVSTTPAWVAKSAGALQALPLPGDRILVILQHGGGIDGLNTVIPRTDDIYYDAQTRPNIRVPKGSEINLDGPNGLHPQLAPLADWWERGNVAIVNNVGYENPNQSHFTSTDIFEYGMNPLDEPLDKGWVARFFDNQCSGCEPNPLDMIASGMSKVPDAMAGLPYYSPPAIGRPSDYGIRAHEDRTFRLRAIQQLQEVPAVDPQLDFIQRTANTAQASIEEIAKAAALGTLVSGNPYSNDSLGRGLQLVSQIIRSGHGTRIFYVNQGGYDTHANQAAPNNPNAGNHPRLLGNFAQSVSAFLTEMDMSDNLDRVLVMTFSEFGRRVKENGSLGTDHGAANCLFVFGGGVNGGVYGGQPDLAGLDRGNLRYRVDFRSVYAKIVEDWLGGQAAPVFGADVYNTILRRDMRLIPFV